MLRHQGGVGARELKEPLAALGVPGLREPPAEAGEHVMAEKGWPLVGR